MSTIRPTAVAVSHDGVPWHDEPKHHPGPDAALAADQPTQQAEDRLGRPPYPPAESDPLASPVSPTTPVCTSRLPKTGVRTQLSAYPWTRAPARPPAALMRPNVPSSRRPTC